MNTNVSDYRRFPVRGRMVDIGGDHLKINCTGTGSPTVRQPRSSLQAARELHTLLWNLQTPGPYILVGHSFGGYNMRVYAGRYRERLSRRGHQIVVQDSDHMVPYKDPEAIVHAIQSVWTGARNR